MALFLDDLPTVLEKKMKHFKTAMCHGYVKLPEAKAMLSDLKVSVKIFKDSCVKTAVEWNLSTKHRPEDPSDYHDDHHLHD